MKNKSNFWVWIDGIIFMISVIALIIILPSTKTLESCPNDMGTAFFMFVSTYCRFGFFGLAILIVAIFAFIQGLVLLSRKSKR